MADHELPDLDAQADAAVGGIFADRGEMVARWILVAEIVSGDGATTQVVAAQPGATLVDALGLLNYGLQVQAERYED